MSCWRPIRMRIDWGVYAPEGDGDTYRRFTGNMSAMLVLDYLLRKRSEAGTLPDNGAFLTTIVSGKMGAAIAAGYQLPVFESLTGFKYIGEKIHQFEETGSYENELQRPVSIANDAECAALGEVLCGPSGGYQNGIMITLGTGVGSGVIINGEIFRGSLRGCCGRWGDQVAADQAHYTATA